MCLKILFIFTAESSDDRKAWSGTMYQAYQGLVRAGYDVDYQCALQNTKNDFVDKLLWEYWKRVPRFFGKNFRSDESFFSVRLFRETLKNVDYSEYDIIFVPTHIAIVNALPKNIKAKIVHLVDATVDSLFDYYSEFSNLLWHNYREAHILGKKAFRRSDLIIASSQWCKNNAIESYKIGPTKIEVIEFGANIDSKDVPAVPKEIDGKKHINIYWSGVNWERKGGDVALECCKEMIRRGWNVSFNMTGMRDLPDSITSLSFVHNYGFLNKNVREEYLKMIDIMSEQDIFLFPSKAECSSIALCEANGFGLPCFVYDTGGTANYVINGQNGYMLPLMSDGKDFADRIISCLENKEMNDLSSGAVRLYKEKLNWEIWSERVKQAIENHFNNVVE